jgi:hypothetical protein
MHIVKGVSMHFNAKQTKTSRVCDASYKIGSVGDVE